MDIRLKKTGRTTRMISEALKLAEQGKYVFLVFASHAQAQGELRALSERFHIEVVGDDKIYWEGGQICFVSYDPSRFDFYSFRMIGAHPSCETLVDHYLIELRLERQLEMLHRFDTPFTTSPAESEEAHE